LWTLEKFRCYESLIATLNKDYFATFRNQAWFQLAIKRDRLNYSRSIWYNIQCISTIAFHVINNAIIFPFPTRIAVHTRENVYFDSWWHPPEIINQRNITRMWTVLKISTFEKWESLNKFLLVAKKLKEESFVNKSSTN
jgi:hypothetical protein